MNKKPVAFIITGNHVNQMGAINEEMPGCMVPLLDRPWLQHLVEYLVNRGLKQFHFFNCDFPQSIEQYFQDGRRWGVDFTYHLGRDEGSLLKQVSLQAELAGDQMILLAQANAILFAIPEFAESVALSSQTFIAGNSDTDCFNWHLLPASDICQAREAASFASLSKRLFEISDPRSHLLVTPDNFLQFQTLKDLLIAQNDALSGKFPDLIFNANEVEPGVRISRNVSLDPTVKIVPPVFLGENSQIFANARLGPNACIGSDCICDNGSTICDACVFSGTYIGEALNIRKSLVNRNNLLNLEIDGQIYLDEDFLLGSMQSSRFTDLIHSVVSRATAFSLFLFFLPVLLLAIILKKVFRSDQSVLIPIECIVTPNNLNQPQLRTFTRYSLSSTHLSQRRRYYHGLAHFIQEFLPGLLAVIAGKMDLIGLQTRTPKEFSSLSKGHQKVFLKGKSGLITENQVRFAGIAGDSELIAAETLHLHKASFSYNFKLLVNYFLSFFYLPGKI